MMCRARITPTTVASLVTVYERSADRTTPAAIRCAPFHTTGSRS